MKGEVMPSIVKVEPNVLKDLMTEVKETIAKDFIRSQVKPSAFTAACLWKIESRRRRAMRTRKKFAL